MRYQLTDPVLSLRGEMDRLFDVFFEEGGAFSPRLARVQRAYPPVTVWESEDNLFIEAELPGVKANSLDLQVEGEELILSGEIPAEEKRGASYHRRERTAGNFRRTVRLPYEVKGGAVDAMLKNGVLTVRLPKAESVKPKKIPVMMG